MKHKIIFATGNRDKLREIREILGDLGHDILSMEEAGVEGDIVEDGTTFGENAEIKARTVWEKTGDIVLADDSGLVIDCLGGEPGIYSARYMEGHPYSERNKVLIERVNASGSSDRSARFVCNIAAVLPDGTVEHAEATYEGIIADAPAGENGFGYDPILYLPELGKTSAELSEEEKNAISHRGKALRAMREILKNRLEEFRR